MDKTKIKSTNGFAAGLVLTLTFILTSLPAFAQTNTVSGTVKDSNGEGIAGVTVMIPGTTRGTSTAADGSYILNAGDATELEYNCLGYKTQKVKVGGRAVIDVTLDEDRTSLDEIVVIGYGVQKRRDIIGSVEMLGTGDIEERFGSSMGISRSLQGAIPGLTITFTDGKPSRDPTIRIRGVENSIGAGGSALVLLDGMEVSMNTVNPDDIASVTVLKDASSTAVYGAKGTFGVILLTSKTPTKGHARITYDGTFNMYQQAAKFETVTNGLEYTDAFLEAYINANGSDPTMFNGIFTFSRTWYDELVRRYNDPNFNVKTDWWSIREDGYYDYYGSTDWYKFLYKDVFFGQSHTITAQGGSDVADYYVSARYWSQESEYNIGDENWKQYNIRARGTVHVKPWLHFTGTADFMYRKSREDDGRYDEGQTYKFKMKQLMATSLFPILTPYNPDGSITHVDVSGPVAHMLNGSQYRDDFTTSVNTKLEVKLDMIKDVLWATADVGYTHDSYKRQLVFGQSTWVSGIYPDQTTTYPGNTTLRTTLTYGQRVTGDATLNYFPRIGENHNLGFMVGFNIENYMYESTELYRNGLMTDSPNYSLMDGDAVEISDAGSYSYGMVGAFFRVSYNYKSKYLVEASGRYDGSSKFPTNQQWGFFPSGSVGWRISEEGFMRNADWLDNLKIRFSVGSAGNGLISDAYAYLSRMNISTSSVVGTSGLFNYSSAPEPVPDGLTWESALTYDLGLDFEALNGRLNFVGDIYRKNTVNMYVVGEELPAVYGNDSPKGNYADMRTDGYELSLSWRDYHNVGGKPLSYYVKLAFWDYTSKITRYTSKTGTLPTIYKEAYYEGMTLGEIWGFECNGLYQSDDEAKQYNLNRFANLNIKYQAGDPKFEDQDGDYILSTGSYTIDDHGDLIKIGNTSPRYQYSIQAGINWNGIGLSFMFQGVGKRDWYPAMESNTFWGMYNRPYAFYYPWFRDRWSEDNRDAYWPRLVGHMAQSMLSMENSRYLQDASYCRLKNITLDYTFPNKIVRKLGLQELKVYFTCENPVCWSPVYKHAKTYDPEGIYPGDIDYGENQTGKSTFGDGDGYSVLKSYTLGLTITL